MKEVSRSTARQESIKKFYIEQLLIYHFFVCTFWYTIATNYNVLFFIRNSRFDALLLFDSLAVVAFYLAVNLVVVAVVVLSVINIKGLSPFAY